MARHGSNRSAALRRTGVLAVLALLWSLMAVTPALANELAQGCPDERVPSGTFDDVKPTNVHLEAIECIVFHNVTQGISDDRYAPGNSVTRGQMATFLARVIDASEAELPAGEGRFDDVGSGHVHADAIERLAAAEIAQGRTESTFAPGDDVTRAQMASFLRRAYEFVTGIELADDVSHFDDIAGNVHEDNINAVAEAGFAKGVGDRQFAPQRTVARDQMASFLARKIDRLVEDGQIAIPGPPASYLSEMSSVDSSASWHWAGTAVRIDAVDYARSLRSDQLSTGRSDWLEYNLDRDFDVLRAVIGVDDASPTGSRAQFDVTVDGRLALTQQVSLADSTEIEVDVSDAARIRIQVTGLEGWPIAAYANPRVIVEDGSDDVDRFVDPVVRSPEAYLSETSSVDSSASWHWAGTAVRIDGVDYARSLRSDQLSTGRSDWLEYNLDRDFDVLRAVIGVDDASATGSRAQFDVTVDGQLALTEQVSLSDSVEIEVDVSDAFRVRVQVTGVDGWPIAAYGDARLMKIPD